MCPEVGLVDHTVILGFPGGSVVKNLFAMWETQVLSLGQEDPLEENLANHSQFLPGEFHGKRSLAGYRLWDRKEWDMTEMTTHTW